MRRLLPYVRPYWSWLVAGGLLAIVVSGADGLIAWLVKPAMDKIFIQRDLTMLKLLPLLILGVYVVKGVGRYGKSYMMASVGERVIRDRKSTRLNSSHSRASRMPPSA